MDSNATTTATSTSATTEKEHKEDDHYVGGLGCRPSLPANFRIRSGTTSSANNNNNNNSRRLNLVSTLIGNCTGMCAAFPSQGRGGVGPSDMQFVELEGLRFIGLGALVDELSPKERVYDTLEQVRTRTERLISIGYLIDKPADRAGVVDKTTHTVPLDVWNNRNRDNNQKVMSKQVQLIVELTTKKRFNALKDELTTQLRTQKRHPNKGFNKYLAGITAHNLGVLAVLTGKPDDAVSYFREAICLKESAFGRSDPEVALSWDELGIQFFARGDFDGALTSFREAHAVRNEQNIQGGGGGGGGGSSSPEHPSVAMVLNNMACCYFQMGNPREALLTLEQAEEIQQKAVGSSAQAELDLLHVAIVICNCGYLKLALKQYEDARSLLEEALLIQQSVLDDHHRAVRDTMSNLEFANAFHS